MNWWLIQKIAYLSLLGIIIIHGTARKDLLNNISWLVLLLVSATFLFEFWAVSLARNRIPNAHVYLIFSPIQVFLMACIYANLVTTRRLRTIGFIGCVLIVIVFVLDFLLFDYRSSNINIVSRSVLYVLFSLLFFQDWIENPKSTLSYRSSMLLFNTAVIFFFVINILFWSVYNTPIQKQYVINKVFKHILYYSNLLFYSIIWYSLIKASAQKKGDAKI